MERTDGFAFFCFCLNSSFPNCTKAYGTLNHLNAHVTMQKHGPKRSPAGKFSISTSSPLFFPLFHSHTDLRANPLDPSSYQNSKNSANNGVNKRKKQTKPNVNANETNNVNSLLSLTTDTDTTILTLPTTVTVILILMVGTDRALGGCLG